MTTAALSLALPLLLLTIAGIAVWSALAWPSLTTERVESEGAVSILIPARDEAGNIDACLATALAQGPSVREVLVYDDRSTDGTAAIVNAVAAADSRVRLVSGRDLPDGWCGKNHACARLAEAARGEWLLFLDADARLAPDALPRLLAEAAQRDVTLMSPWPALTAVTFWERVLMPMLEVLTFSVYPAPLSFLRNDPSLGLVHGACILARRSVYESIGGHAAIRAEILEDQRLAHLWRERGGRGLCVLGRDAVQVRMYRSLREIWFGFGKNFYPAFRAGWSFWAFLLLHAAIFLGPIVYLLIAPGYAAAASLALLIIVRVALAVRFRHSAWSLVLHPLADTILLAIGVASWWRCRSGRGVEWKGRRYQVTHVAARPQR
ncbi:MAG: glycosyltransferase family 2 protein [Vicinamibacterales bacterium]